MSCNSKNNKMYQARDFACRRMGNFFTIFAHSTRMRIFCALENGPQTVTRIADEAGISTSNASQHLRLMRDRGAVVTERQGQSIYYRMADRRFTQAANLVREALEGLSNNNEHIPHAAVAQEKSAAAPDSRKLQTRPQT
jgi:ArsR family transcriptional regulator